jgi:guanosine-3',5'-bis(diphosphate) 3'-pyrophosphohydrolase
MQTDVQRLTKAFFFAAQKHTDQRRKGARAEPYLNHPAEVAELLASHGCDIDTVEAGILHDTVEDTDTTPEELASVFRQSTADLVMEVTDNTALPRAERKRMQIETAPHKSDRARNIKMADRTSNLRSIINSPAPHWTTERKIAYFDESRQLVDNCRSANPALAETFDRTYAWGMSILKGPTAP